MVLGYWVQLITGADFVPAIDEDAEEGDFDCELEIIERA